MLRIIGSSWKNQPKQVMSVKHINTEMRLVSSVHLQSWGFKCSRFLAAKGLRDHEEVELTLWIVIKRGNSWNNSEKKHLSLLSST